jgi:hypothetical protein
MRTQARFRTSLFPIPAPDADQAENGRALADFLRAILPFELRADAMAEDWGQRLVFHDPALASVTVACGHVEDDQWSCACDASPRDEAARHRVVAALDAALAASPAITDLEWFANDARHQEVNHAPRAFAPDAPAAATPATPPMRGMGRAQRYANAAAIAALALLIGGHAAGALLYGAAALPLWLALFAARKAAPVALRGVAIFTNIACALGCALLLAFTAVHAVTQGMDPSRAALAAALFVPILALNLLNLRALVGPAVDTPNSPTTRRPSVTTRPDVAAGEDDLTDPAIRKARLLAIAPTRDSARRSHALLLKLLGREREYRSGDGAQEYFENLYWCAFLLYLVGDVRDAVALWDAKETNFDTHVGFDVQNLVGAGVRPTLDHLGAVGATQAHEYVRKCQASGDFDDLAGWERDRIRYYYGES